MASSEEHKIYKIRRNKDGLFSDGGTWPSFSKKGKTWATKGAIVGHLVQAMHGSDDEARSYGDGSDFEIIEIVVRHEDGTHDSLATEISKIARRRVLKSKHGISLANLMESLDKSNKLEDFRWALLLGISVWGTEYKQFEALMTQHKIKKSKIRSSMNAVAFADKETAMLFRLSIDGQVKSIDLVQLSEDF